MKKKEYIIKIVSILLFFSIVVCRAVLPKNNLGTYLVPVGIMLILLFNHIFMPQFTDLPGDNPKVKTMRRVNMLAAQITDERYHWD